MPTILVPRWDTFVPRRDIGDPAVNAIFRGLTAFDISTLRPVIKLNDSALGLS